MGGFSSFSTFARLVSIEEICRSPELKMFDYWPHSLTDGFCGLRCNVFLISAFPPPSHTETWLDIRTKGVPPSWHCYGGSCLLSLLVL